MEVSLKFSTKEKVSKTKNVKKKMKIQYEMPVLVKIENVNVATGRSDPFGTGKVAACINGSFA